MWVGLSTRDNWMASPSPKIDGQPSTNHVWTAGPNKCDLVYINYIQYIYTCTYSCHFMSFHVPVITLSIYRSIHSSIYLILFSNLIYLFLCNSLCLSLYPNMSIWLNLINSSQFNPVLLLSIEPGAATSMVCMFHRNSCGNMALGNIPKWGENPSKKKPSRPSKYLLKGVPSSKLT